MLLRCTDRDQINPKFGPLEEDVKRLPKEDSFSNASVPLRIRYFLDF